MISSCLAGVLCRYYTLPDFFAASLSGFYAMMRSGDSMGCLGFLVFFNGICYVDDVCEPRLEEREGG
jgi:hypothetical protein